MRRAILREAGLSDEAIADLTTGQYQRPLTLWPLRVFVAGVLRTTADKVNPGEAPLILDAVADVKRESFDPAEAATESLVNLRVRGESDGVKFDALKYHVTAPGRIKLAGLDDAKAAPG